MERTKNIINKYSIVIIYILYGVGVIGHSTSGLYDTMIFLTPFTLLLTGLFVLYLSIYNRSKVMLIWVSITYLVTFSLEVFGVETGFIFGNYQYGNSLGLKLFDVPLIIGFNWVMVILGTIAIVKLFTDKTSYLLLVAPLLALLFDFLLEPIAIKLDYWIWDNNIIPIQNYAAWYFIALFSVYFFYKLEIRFNIKYSAHYYIAQFLFFILLSIFI